MSAELAISSNLQVCDVKRGISYKKKAVDDLLSEG